MGRDARINPIAGDVLARGLSQWEVVSVDAFEVKVLRDGGITTLLPERFRSFFKLASTVRYGDEQ